MPNCNSFFQNDSATVCDRSLGRNEDRGESDMKPKLFSSAGEAASDAPHRGSCRAFGRPWIVAFALTALSSAHAFAADRINGQVTAAGGPVEGSTVTLWAASADAPRQLAQTRTRPDGRFALSGDGRGAIL